MALTDPATGPEQQRRRARRNAFALMLVALAIYAAFIVMSVRRGAG